MRLLIDADILAFKAATLSEVETHWGGDLWTMHSFLQPALRLMEDQLAGLIEAIGVPNASPVLCFSDELNWRKVEYPAYKANRSGRKPLAFRPLLAHCQENYPVLQMPYLEADDVMGIEATRCPETTIIVSIDKDMRTIPCALYDWNKPELGVQEIQDEDADRWLATQALTGDATDGYPGCPGVGPVKAAKVLDGLTDEYELWDAVAKAYEAKGLSTDDMIQQSRLARICRDGDWDDATAAMTWEPSL